jgi:hypothetical protein
MYICLSLDGPVHSLLSGPKAKANTFRENIHCAECRPTYLQVLYLAKDNLVTASWRTVVELRCVPWIYFIPWTNNLLVNALYVVHQIKLPPANWQCVL